MSDHPLPAGKLPLPLLEKLLARFAPSDPRIIVGPRTGEDAAVFDFGDRYLVAKTDPITFATSEIGWYAVNVNANDVAVMGATPRWFLATVLLPAGRGDCGDGRAHLCRHLRRVRGAGGQPRGRSHRDHAQPGSPHHLRHDAGGDREGAADHHLRRAAGRCRAPGQAGAHRGDGAHRIRAS